jgi:broad specificity phosphatase PhoE
MVEAAEVGSAVPEILVVRHGESAYNAEDRWTGQDDPPLSDAGRAATERLAEELDDLAFVGIASSDLRRSRETAEILASLLDLPAPTQVPALREREMGDWTGLTKDEIDRRWPGWRDRWKEDELLELPGGEHRDDFDARVLAALRGLGKGFGRDDRLLVVGHAGTRRALDRHVTSIDSRPNLAVVWLEVEGDVLRSRAS